MIDSKEALRSLYPPAKERSVRKQLDHLDPHCLRFVALSPFVVLSSCSRDGKCDASPRGGEPGFVKVLDAKTLHIPDAPGNNRLDTLENLLRDPRIGLLFMVPGVDETLRINGSARLRDEPAFADHFAQERQRPKVVIEVRVEEAYLHCAKAFMRSSLWDAASWPRRDLLPSMNEMIHDHIGAEGALAESPAEMAERYRKQLAEEQTPTR